MFIQRICTTLLRYLKTIRIRCINIIQRSSNFYLSIEFTWITLPWNLPNVREIWASCKVTWQYFQNNPVSCINVLGKRTVRIPSSPLPWKKKINKKRKYLKKRGGTNAKEMQPSLFFPVQRANMKKGGEGEVGPPGILNCIRWIFRDRDVDGLHVRAHERTSAPAYARARNLHRYRCT